MKTKLLKKLRRKFSKRYVVKTFVFTGSEYFRIYDEGFHLYTLYDREDLHQHLRKLYFSFLEEYIKNNKKSEKSLTYWW